MIVAKLSNSYVAEVSLAELAIIKLALERFTRTWQPGDSRKIAMEDQAKLLIEVIHLTLKASPK